MKFDTMEDVRKNSGELDWDSGLDAFYDEVVSDSSKADKPAYQMAIDYLEAVFNPGDIVSFVHNAYKKDDGRYAPADSGCALERDKIIRSLKKNQSLEDSFGTIDPSAGAWIRFNTVEGKNATSYRHALVKGDSLDLEAQKQLLVSFKLPIAALIESGGKTLHAIVKVDAHNEAEYKQRTSFLYDWCAKHKLIVDPANANPARLTRLPGAGRNGNTQKLLFTNIGCESWLDWKDFIEGVDDDLPPLTSFWEQLQNPPKKSPELISGILREGCKMIITGESKAGKTCLTQNLAACVAEGKPWLGKWNCAQGKVLYLNLEVEEASLFERFKQIYSANGWEFTEESCKNIIPWNLRGHAIPLEKLAPKIIRRCRALGSVKMVVIDPLYKVQFGDENSAGDIGAFCNAVDQISHETGAAVVYDHHHRKGSPSEKVIDRGSGSGVFARDADAICDISFLSPSDEVKRIIGAQLQAGEKPMQISFVLRDFKDDGPYNMFFKFPVHYLDTENYLIGVPVEGSREANLQKSSKRTTVNSREATLEEAFRACCDERGRASIKDMADWCGGKPTERTLRRYVEETPGYSLEKGIVQKGFLETDFKPLIKDPVESEDVEAEREKLTKEFEDLSAKTRAKKEGEK